MTSDFGTQNEKVPHWNLGIIHFVMVYDSIWHSKFIKLFFTAHYNIIYPDISYLDNDIGLFSTIHCSTFNHIHFGSVHKTRFISHGSYCCTLIVDASNDWIDICHLKLTSWRMT
jgi:hypothetical protein